MSLAGELAKYAGGELAKASSKELAKAGASSMLSSLVPNMATKVGSEVATKSVLNSLVPSATRKLASGVELGTDMIPMFRGQMNTLDKLDYNKGLSPNSNGFFMTPNKSATDSWAGKGVVSVDADPNDIMTLSELNSLKKDAEKYMSDPKLQMQLYNENPDLAEIYDALYASDNYQNLSKLTNKPFIERDGGQGTELGEVVFFPDTRPELTTKYNDLLASGKNQWATPAVDETVSDTALPAGTKISFNKDLSIKSIDKPSRGRGWFADNSDNPHIAQAIKQSGADKYLGEPKINYSLIEEDGRFDKLLKKAKNYKSLERFEKMNNPIKGSEIWGEKPKGMFERDSRAVRINMFPNEATKGTGITKQHLLNLFKDAYDQGITSIVPSYGSYTKEGASFMDHLAEQGWVKATGRNGWNSYEIAPKIAEWEKTTPLADIYNSANGIVENNESLTEMAKKLNAMKASRDMSDGIRRIGSAEVAALDEGTLPEGWKQLEKYLDTADKRLEKAIGKPRSKITKQDLITFLEDYGYDTEGTKNDLWKNALMCIDDMAVDELYEAGGAAGQFLQERLPFRSPRDMRDATYYYIGNKGRTGRLDAEYSDRLGIGRSNTPMSDDTVSWGNDAGGSYARGGFGTNPTWATGESGVSTVAHERMHAWQDINKFDWDERVGDAIDELRSELKKFYHSEDEIKKYWGNSKTDYYKSDIEQEARMLQSYLDNEGFTNTYKRTSEKGTEWGDEIKPAFDKFYKKLRALSKAGIALPAVALMFGLSANGGENKDKKLDNVE